MRHFLLVPFCFPLQQLLPECIGGSIVKAACFDLPADILDLLVCEQIIGFPANLVGQAFTGGFFRGGIDRSSLVCRDMCTLITAGGLLLFVLFLVFIVTVVICFFPFRSAYWLK